MFPGSGCPVPESPASGTASAVSKGVREGADASRAIAMVGGSLVSFGCQLIDPDVGTLGLLQYAITLKVTSPRALDRPIW